MSGLIAWLEKLNEADSKARAVLRRSLAFDPGQHIPAFPYVEPFLKGEQEGWRRDVHYLVAALWAAHWREGRTGAALSLARASAAHQIKSGSGSEAHTSELQSPIRNTYAVVFFKKIKHNTQKTPH